MKKQRKPCRIAHLPDYQKSNPYQNLLLNNLSKIGFDARYGNKKVYFKNIDLSIIYSLIKNKKVDIIHLHWQHPFLIHDNLLLMLFRSCLFIFQLFLLKFLSVKLVWTVHNLKNHDNKFIKTELYFSRLIAMLSDAVLSHCSASKDEIVEQYRINKSKVYIIPHGNYIQVYKNMRTRKQSRDLLKLADTDFTFLFLGLIRPYKGIDNLIDSFRKISHSSVKLIIAGRIEDRSFVDFLFQKASSCTNIICKFEYIDDDEIEVYMKAANALVLPYRDIINSGSAILGMSFGKVIIAPRLGCMPEILQSGGGILYDADDEKGLLEAMKTAMEAKTNIDAMGKANYELAKKWTWKRIAASTGEVYSKCLGKL